MGLNLSSATCNHANSSKWPHPSAHLSSHLWHGVYSPYSGNAMKKILVMHKGNLEKAPINGVFPFLIPGRTGQFPQYALGNRHTHTHTHIFMVPGWLAELPKMRAFAAPSSHPRKVQRPWLLAPTLWNIVDATSKSTFQQNTALLDSSRSRVHKISS